MSTITFSHALKLGLSHPEQDDWQNNASTFPEETLHLLGMLPLSKDLHVSEILDTLLLVTDQITEERLAKHTTNLAFLKIPEEEKNIFHSRAGRPEMAAKNIRWLGEKLVKVHESGDMAGNKVSLEHGGNIQYGLWGTTLETDDLVWNLFKQVKNEFPEDAEKIHSYGYDELVRNRFIPYEGKNSLPDIKFGLCRKRRAVLDYRFEVGGIPVSTMTYKQSLGLVVLEAIDPTLRQLISRTYINPNGQPEPQQTIIVPGTNGESMADFIAGQLFMRAKRIYSNNQFSGRPTVPDFFFPIDTRVVTTAIIKDPGSPNENLETKTDQDFVI